MADRFLLHDASHPHKETLIEVVRQKRLDYLDLSGYYALHFYRIQFVINQKQDNQCSIINSLTNTHNLHMLQLWGQIRASITYKY